MEHTQQVSHEPVDVFESLAVLRRVGTVAMSCVVGGAEVHDNKIRPMLFDDGKRLIQQIACEPLFVPEGEGSAALSLGLISRRVRVASRSSVLLPLIVQVVPRAPTSSYPFITAYAD